MAFNPVDVELVKDSTDIVAVIGRYVELKRAGSSWKGLCPFHREKTPSFNVSPDRGTWKCFGCGKGGDVIRFLEDIRNLSFLEVVQELAEENGITLKITSDGGESAQRKTSLYKLLEDTQKFFSVEFGKPHGKAARSYLRSRKIDEALVRLGIGYAPGGNALLEHLEEKGYSISAMEEARVVSNSGRGPYDFFRNRLTFPIRDRRGRVVSFGARALDDSEPKYLNGQDSAVYSKGTFLYGYSRAQKHARNQGRVILVEGYFDHARLLSEGFEEAVATSGTALTEKQARNLMGMADRILICYDGDSPGSKAAVKAAEIILSQGGFPGIVKLPEGMDPDDMILNRGRNEFEILLENAMDPVSFGISLLGGNPGSGAGRVRKAHRLLQVAMSASDPLVEEELRKKVEEFTGYSRTALLRASEAAEPSEMKRRVSVSDSQGELSCGDRALLRAATAGGKLDRDLLRFLCREDMESVQGRQILEELQDQIEKGYSSLMFGELSENSAGICADISGYLPSVTTADIQRLKLGVERNRREKPRRRELLRELREADPERRAVILEDLTDGGGLHER